MADFAIIYGLAGVTLLLGLALGVGQLRKARRAAKRDEKSALAEHYSRKGQ